MTAVAVAETDLEAEVHQRTFRTGVRLALAANTTFQLSFLFAYIYLKANNFGGGWRPDGIANLSAAPQVIALIFEVATLVAVVLAARAPAPSAARGLVGAGLLCALVTLVVRIVTQRNLGAGWTLSGSTYNELSMLWLAVIIGEVALGALWLLNVMFSYGRGAATTVTSMHVRGFIEYWLYLTVLGTIVWLVVRYV